MKNTNKEKRNIDPILKKGMDITISILKQEFPFIIDWDYDEDTDNYHTALYINLICDLKKTSEFYDSEVHFIYKDNPIIKQVYPTGPLNKNREIESDDKHRLYNEIISELNEIYENLPEDYVEKNDWGENKSINVEGFIFYNKQETINESNKINPSVIEELLYDVLNINKELICDIEYENKEERFDINGKQVFNSPSVTVTFLGHTSNKMRRQEKYDKILDEIWETIYDMTGIGIDLYSKYVNTCEQETINESKEKTNYIPIIKELVEPFKNEDAVCDIDVIYDEEDDMYSVYLVLGNEELNDNFYYVDGIRTYRNKLVRKIKEEINTYLPIDNLYVGSYGKPNCGWSPLNESISDGAYIDLFSDIVQSYKDNETICDIEVSYDKEDDMYTIMILFDTEELLKIRDRGRYARQIRNEIGEEIVKYVPDFMNFYVGSYVRHCKESKV